SGKNPVEAIERRWSIEFSFCPGEGAVTCSGTETELDGGAQEKSRNHQGASLSNKRT
ncbi:unnamed protein product, partial [Amoebophrya sp. A25]